MTWPLSIWQMNFGPINPIIAFGTNIKPSYMLLNSIITLQFKTQGIWSPVPWKWRFLTHWTPSGNSWRHVYLAREFQGERQETRVRRGMLYNGACRAAILLLNGLFSLSEKCNGKQINLILHPCSNVKPNSLSFKKNKIKVNNMLAKYRVHFIEIPSLTRMIISLE